MIAVIGSGPVGIFVSYQLLKQGKNVVLFDAGNEFNESSNLNRESYEFLTPSALPKNVHRIGGGSNYWMNRVSQFIDMDFEGHISRPATKWPLSLHEIRGLYEELENEVLPESLSEQDIENFVLGLTPSGLPRNLALRPFRYMSEGYFNNLLRELKRNPRFFLKSNHFCLDFKNRESCEVEIRFATAHGTVTEVVDSLVIACGALQSPSLVSRAFEAKGLDTNSIGSELMEHIEGYVGSIKVNSSQRKLISPFVLGPDRRVENQAFGVGIALSEEILQKNGWPNFQVELVPYIPDYKINRILASNPNKFKNHAYKFILSIFSFIERVFKKSFYRIVTLLSKIVGVTFYSIWVKSEEFPNKSSGVKYDPFTSKTIYDHKVSALTSKKLQEGLLFLSKNIQNEGLGRIHLYPRLLRSDNSFYLRPNWHPMGTLPMRSKPNHSHVDSNQALVGFNNVYLCDASLFPSGSNSNPVFTALMLSLRLSKRL